MIKQLLVMGLIFAPPSYHINQSVKVEPQIFKVGKSQYEIQQEELAKWKTGSLTGYCNCKDVMNGETGITAYGYDLDAGIFYRGYRILATDPSIPFGTLIDIKLNGTLIHGIVLDRGGAIRGSHFDIVMPSRSSAFELGRQEIKFKVVGKLF